MRGYYARNRSARVGIATTGLPPLRRPTARTRRLTVLVQPAMSTHEPRKEKDDAQRTDTGLSLIEEVGGELGDPHGPAARGDTDRVRQLLREAHGALLDAEGDEDLRFDEGWKYTTDGWADAEGECFGGLIDDEPVTVDVLWPESRQVSLTLDASPEGERTPHMSVLGHLTPAQAEDLARDLCMAAAVARRWDDE